MKLKKVKFPKKYKYGWRLAGDSSKTVFFLDRFRISKWLFRPICWIKGHGYHIYWPFGIKIKCCDRCGYIKYKKQTTEKVPSVYEGEIGKLYGIRFVVTKGTNAELRPSKDEGNEPQSTQ